MILNILEVSIGHISEETTGWLSNEMDGPTTYIEPYGLLGWLVYVEHDPDSINEVEEGYPEDLKQVLSYARSNHCHYIMIDSIFEPIKDLPSYD